MSQVPSSVFWWFSSLSRRGLLKADDSSRKHVYCYFLSMGYHFLPASSTKEKEWWVAVIPRDTISWRKEFAKSQLFFLA